MKSMPAQPSTQPSAPMASQPKMVIGGYPSRKVAAMPNANESSAMDFKAAGAPSAARAPKQ